MPRETLEERLAALRARLATAPATSISPRECLTFERARALALDPGRGTAVEERHRAGCRRCGLMLESFGRQLPHLSLWTLLRRQLGRLSEGERRVVRYHLMEGGCLRCRQREERLQALAGQATLLRGPILFRDPAMVGAATPRPQVTARSETGDLAAELVETGPEAILEVRTKQVALNHRLVGYSLAGAEGTLPEEGFQVLRPEVEGWYAGHVSLDAAALHARLLGRCEEVLVTLADPEALTVEEQDLVVAAAGRDAGDPAASAAWTAWATGEEMRESAAPDVLARVRACLATSA